MKISAAEQFVAIEASDLKAATKQTVQPIDYLIRTFAYRFERVTPHPFTQTLVEVVQQCHRKTGGFQASREILVAQERESVVETPPVPSGLEATVRNKLSIERSTTFPRFSLSADGSRKFSAPCFEYRERFTDSGLRFCRAPLGFLKLRLEAICLFQRFQSVDPHSCFTSVAMTP
jgi:hypothetical protein